MSSLASVREGLSVIQSLVSSFTIGCVAAKTKHSAASLSTTTVSIKDRQKFKCLLDYTETLRKDSQYGFCEKQLQEVSEKILAIRQRLDKESFSLRKHAAAIHDCVQRVIATSWYDELAPRDKAGHAQMHDEMVQLYQTNEEDAAIEGVSAQDLNPSLCYANDGVNLFEMVCREGDPEHIVKFLDCRALPNVWARCAPIKVIKNHNFSTEIRLLILDKMVKAGVDCNVCRNEGEPFISDFLFCEYTNGRRSWLKNVVSIMLKGNLNINIGRKRNISPLDLALVFKDEDLASYLAFRGAQVAENASRFWDSPALSTQQMAINKIARTVQKAVTVTTVLLNDIGDVVAQYQRFHPDYILKEERALLLKTCFEIDEEGTKYRVSSRSVTPSYEV